MARLIAEVDLRPGDCIVVADDSAVVVGPSEPWAHEVCFDGGAQARDGVGKVAGAGAVLWGPVQPDGTRAVLRVARVSLPGEEYARVAEAWGLRLALLLLCDLLNVRRSARIVGDNLAVVRYGASQGRLHQPDMQGVLEQVLARVLLLGWDLQWAAAAGLSLIDDPKADKILNSLVKLDDEKIRRHSLKMRMARFNRMQGRTGASS